MAINNIYEIFVDADLSRTLPIYRPCGDIPKHINSIFNHIQQANQTEQRFGLYCMRSTI